MNAGRDLDALVAEKVMGFAYDGAAWWTHPNGTRTSVDGLPRFSTDIAAAWLVVERLRETGHGLVVKAYPMSVDYDYDYTAHVPRIDMTISAPTAPLAICLAALKAVGVDL